MSDGAPEPNLGSRHEAARQGRGFSTRALAAASRAPRLEQTPTSVPIYQTATFSAADFAAALVAIASGGPDVGRESVAAFGGT